jgi:hypothetical protein
MGVYEVNDSVVTFGCIMAEVSVKDSGEIESSSGEEVKLTFFPTSDSVDGRIVVTNEMRRLGDAGYFPIAIARINVGEFSQFVLQSLPGLSESLRVALEDSGYELVTKAFDSVACNGSRETPVTH